MIYYDRGDVLIRDAHVDDVQSLKGRLRSEDAEEVLASGNDSVESALAQSHAKSVASFTVEHRGIPVAMFGIRPDTVLGESARVWLLGANEMALIKKTFVKLSRRVIADFLREYPVMWNVVDSRYGKACRWIESCGAKYDGFMWINGVLFYKFVFRRA